jgi:hypothetical protein
MNFVSWEEIKEASKVFLFLGFVFSVIFGVTSLIPRLDPENKEIKQPVAKQEIDLDDPFSDRMIQRRGGSYQMSCMFGNLMMKAVNEKEDNPVLLTDIDYIHDTNTRVYILEYNEVKYLVVENTETRQGGISVTKME